MREAMSEQQDVKVETGSAFYRMVTPERELRKAVEVFDDHLRGTAGDRHQNMLMCVALLEMARRTGGAASNRQAIDAVCALLNVLTKRAEQAVDRRGLRIHLEQMVGEVVGGKGEVEIVIKIDAD